MEVNLRLPSKMDLFNALNFCRYLEGLDYPNIDKMIYNAEHISHVEPFGMLLVGAKLREIRRRHGSVKYAYDVIDNPNSYVGHMGFFKSIGMAYGREPGEASGGATYVPISKIPVESVRRQALEKRCEVADIVEAYAEEFAGVLYSGDKGSWKQMVFAIREIMRNVVEHSKAQTIWYAGQAWPTKDILEIAVLDDGIGIQKSLDGNSHYKELVTTTESALNFSLLPGVTRTFSPSRLKKRDEDAYINTGFGLYMTSNICKEFGNFCIASGGAALFKIGEGVNFWETAYRGTAIRMRLRISKLGEIAKLRSQLVRSGEREAKTNAKAIATASKASKLTSLREQS